MQLARKRVFEQDKRIRRISLKLITFNNNVITIDRMEEDKLKVYEISSRFSKNQTEIIQKVKDVCERHLRETEGEDLEAAAKTRADQDIAKDLKKEIDDLTSNNWNIIVGNKFSASIGKGKEDQYGHFRVGELNILILESPLRGGKA